ncbi:MAG: LysR family transcriptional regulator [Mesorhizobium sp.]|uniref:LysR substrate-binding domain-containing protein n=1 Tax=Mesorhizobium sp. TaxID=1871066 RepID=UPI000FE9DF6B|nr:LysR substrate-binding domain-containing protein [Mesorhizobium sp.]RWG49149.1 MAG: LysR family transcriptional regulator [Mesorhizobium sp.]
MKLQPGYFEMVRILGLPSLNALAAFEAAARQMSLTKAAEELNVTPGAVSKHVRTLEEDLGVPLFLRLHRSLELTREGEAMAAAVREGFERVLATYRQIKMAGGQPSVTVGSTMAMAQLWLIPRMSEFWAAHRDIAVEHFISDHPRGLDRADIDLRIRYGVGEWPDEEAAKLYDDIIFPVASPEFASKHAVQSLEEIAALQLLSVERIDSTWTDWPDFFRELGCRDRRLNTRRCNSYVIAMQSARSGQGVALAWANLVRPWIETGDLVRLTDAQINAPHSYFVTWNSRRPLNRQTAILRDWMVTLQG